MHPLVRDSLAQARVHARIHPTAGTAEFDVEVALAMRTAATEHPVLLDVHCSHTKGHFSRVLFTRKAKVRVRVPLEPPPDASLWVSVLSLVHLHGRTFLLESGTGRVLLARAIKDAGAQGVALALARPEERHVQKGLGTVRVVVGTAPLPPLTFVQGPVAPPLLLMDERRQAIAALTKSFRAGLQSCVRRHTEGLLQPDLCRASTDKFRAHFCNMLGMDFFDLHQRNTIAPRAVRVMFNAAILRAARSVEWLVNGLQRLDHDALDVLAEALTMLPTALEYIPDYDADGTIIDSYGDALMRLSGDCEDFAWWIIAVGEWLQTADVGDDRVLAAAQDALRHFVLGAVLELVSGAKLDDRGLGLGHGFDNPRFRAGAHMAAVAMPTELFNEALARGGVVEGLPHAEAREARLPVLSFEGTGRLHGMEGMCTRHTNLSRSVGVPTRRAMREDMGRTESPNDFYYVVKCMYPVLPGRALARTKDGREVTLRCVYTATNRALDGSAASPPLHGVAAADFYAGAVPRGEYYGADALVLVPVDRPSAALEAAREAWRAHSHPFTPLHGVVSAEYAAEVRMQFDGVVARARAALGARYCAAWTSGERGVTSHVLPLAKLAERIDRVLDVMQRRGELHMQVHVLADGVASVTMLVRDV